MKVAIVGATGWIGGALLAEASDRGHAITAVVRDSTKLPDGSSGRRVVCDILDIDKLISAFQGQEALLHAFAPARDATDQERIDRQTAGTNAIIAAAKAAGVRRLIAVGGAGTSQIAPGVKLMDSYLFPKKWAGGARSTAVIRTLLEADGTLDWTFVSPPHIIEPGPRTGHYRTGTDNLLFEESTGRSYISVADYAVALIDELEKPAHIKMRFTVGT